MNCEALKGRACNKGAGNGFESCSSATVVDVILGGFPGLGFFKAIIVCFFVFFYYIPHDCKFVNI